MRYLEPQDLCDLVHHRIQYCRHTGRLTHKLKLPGEPGQKQFNLRWAGREAFTALNVSKVPHGRIFGVTILAKNAAWALHYGYWPTGQVITANGDKCDLRACNLRMEGCTHLLDVL